MLVFNLGVDGFLGGGSLQIMSTNCVEGPLCRSLAWCGVVKCALCGWERFMFQNCYSPRALILRWLRVRQKCFCGEESS